MQLGHHFFGEKEVYYYKLCLKQGGAWVAPPGSPGVTRSLWHTYNPSAGSSAAVMPSCPPPLARGGSLPLLLSVAEPFPSSRVHFGTPPPSRLSLGSAAMLRQHQGRKDRNAFEPQGVPGVAGRRHLARGPFLTRVRVELLRLSSEACEGGPKRGVGHFLPSSWVVCLLLSRRVEQRALHAREGSSSSGSSGEARPGAFSLEVRGSQFDWGIQPKGRGMEA